MAYKVLNNISLKDVASSGLSKLKTDLLVIVINKNTKSDSSFKEINKISKNYISKTISSHLKDAGSNVLLPKIDGITVLEKWRKSKKNFPVLILTARDQWSDKVSGFDAGADDYVTKPFQMEELMARLRALIRRSAGHASSDIECGPLRIDTKSNKVFVNGTKLKLTSHEYKIIEYFLHHQDKVITRTELIEHIYDQDFDRDSNTIEVFIGRLRKKMGLNLIKTERGYGYRLSIDKE